MDGRLILIKLRLLPILELGIDFCGFIGLLFSSSSSSSGMMHVALSSSFLLLACQGFTVPPTFVLQQQHHQQQQQQHYQQQQTTTTSLHAIGVLAKRAKEMDLRKYAEGGLDDDVQEKLDIIKQYTSSDNGNDSNNKEEVVGPLQQALTKRRGTISVVAEYKRKLDSGYVDEIFDPEILSPIFRDNGAAAVAVMADERMGGCTYDDVSAFVAEQSRAWAPCFVVNSDMIIDALQVARTAACNANALTLPYGLLKDNNVFGDLLLAAQAVGLESMAQVSTADEAQGAVDAGARILVVVGVEGVEGKYAVVENLVVPDGAEVCTVAAITARDNGELEEIEEAWMCRDKGFNSVWVADALYKGGNNPAEHPGAIINSMKAKSSVKYASPRARTGKGEGAREYLGDLLM
eukprot:CAMPEP_0118696662 /NCGR_PEP_ID=MMETSP0800-20121206/13987_1 /TAXON_ID=210618 ORGANISM="Striatella unipunctata, Strain CCMP2910" /NCGR_SAMPLE_ID=MMETSP0800 /ASSEMBLY_ACC=CAM_ASM_000638 /LENGTH=404 /DNA_ID=CAMNT_0006595831 /DNA_START=470 /DNA_END=1684 /DNA_ORIENTATION=-